MNAEDFEELINTGAWHDGGYALSDHRLAGPGRTNHQQIVAATDRDLDGAAHGVLAFNFGEISPLRLRRCLVKAAVARFGRKNITLSIEKAHGFVETADGIDVDVFNQRGFVGRFGGHDEALLAKFARQHRHCE